MNLTEYLENEGITDRSDSLAVDMIIDFLGEVGFEKYESLCEKMSSSSGEGCVVEFYDFIAGHGLAERLENRLYKRLVKTVPFVNSRLNGSNKVIDLGCGVGIKTIYYGITNPQTEFVGVDLSGKSIEIARQRARKYCCRNVTFMQGDMKNIEHGNFDFAIAEYSMHETRWLVFDP